MAPLLGNKLRLLGMCFLAVATLATASGNAHAQMSGEWSDYWGIDSGTEDNLSAEEYEALSAADKSRYLWEERILPSEYYFYPDLNLAGGWNALTGALGSFFDLNTSFDRVSDEMPPGRKKFIHPYGSVALVEFRGNPNSPYTGLFREKATPGLVRVSLAGPPMAIGYTPGMAVKLFVDGGPSVNTHVMNSLDGQGSNRNFFEYPFSNIIQEPEGLILKILAGWFGLFVDDPFRVSLDHFAATDRRGRSVDVPVAPYQIFLVPGENVGFDPNTSIDMRDEFAEIEPGTVLYEVYARDEFDNRAMFIGELVTTSRFVASEWGDKGLFFQHRE